MTHESDLAPNEQCGCVACELGCNENSHWRYMSASDFFFNYILLVGSHFLFLFFLLVDGVTSWECDPSECLDELWLSLITTRQFFMASFCCAAFSIVFLALGLVLGHLHILRYPCIVLWGQISGVLTLIRLTVETVCLLIMMAGFMWPRCDGLLLTYSIATILFNTLLVCFLTKWYFFF